MAHLTKSGLEEDAMTTLQEYPRTVFDGERICITCRQEAQTKKHTVSDCLAALRGLTARLEKEEAKQVGVTTP